MTIDVTSTSGGFKTLEILNTAYAWFDWFIPSSADIPLGSAPGISYSQSSVLTGLQAAAEAEMQNDTWKSTTQTATQINAGEHWIRMDLGSVRPIVGIVVGALPDGSYWDTVPDDEHFDPALFETSPGSYTFPTFAFPGVDVIEASNDGVLWWAVCPILGRDDTGYPRWPTWPGSSNPILHEYTTGASPVPDRQFFEYTTGVPVTDYEYELLRQEVAYAPRIPKDLRARYIRVRKPASQYGAQSLSVTELYVKVRSAP
jgi:hypothetical protein